VVIPSASSIALLFGSLVIILAGAELFTNGIEWLGRKLKLGEGAVGSVLAAVGTALPETMIPVAAILLTPSADTHQVGIGAIAGAPFMLGTLAFCVTGASVYLWAKRGRRSSAEMRVNVSVIRRDLAFFLMAYGLAVATTFVRDVRGVRLLVAFTLLALYGVYAWRTFTASAAEGDAPRHLHLSRLFRTGMAHHPRTAMVIVQVVVALGLIVGGAELFVHDVVSVARRLGAPPLLLSLLIAPVATELPEKLNSVLWTRDRKDTLALGNITGAMVFQSCFPVALGVILTPWALEGATLVSAILALASAAILYISLRVTGRVSPAVLLLGGIFYAFFVGLVLVRL